jgi:hypothetical protein
MERYEEPKLVELLDEPIARLLMERDHVDPREVEALLVRVRETLAAPRD